MERGHGRCGHAAPRFAAAGGGPPGARCAVTTGCPGTTVGCPSPGTLRVRGPGWSVWWWCGVLRSSLRGSGDPRRAASSRCWTPSGELCPWVEPARSGCAPSRPRGRAVSSAASGCWSSGWPRQSGRPSVPALRGRARSEPPDPGRGGRRPLRGVARCPVRADRPPGGTAEFLAPWSVAVLQRPELGVTLQRLGIHTLGQFAALPASDVEARFGGDAAALPPGGPGPGGGAAGLRDPGIARRLREVSGLVPAPTRQGTGSSAGPRRPSAGPSPVLRPGPAAAGARRSSWWPAEGRAGPGRQGAAGPVGRPRPARGPASRVPAGVRPGRPLAGPAPSALTGDRPRRARPGGTGGRGGRPPSASPGAGCSRPSRSPARSRERPGRRWSRGPGPGRPSSGGGRSRRRRARLQVVTAPGVALLLVVAGERWWLAGLYD